MHRQSLTWADQNWTVHREGGLYWIDQQTLVLSDLHLGKAASFRRRGVPVPAGTTKQVLDRVDTLLNETGPQRLILLGDLLHHRLGTEAEADGQGSAVVNAFAAWRNHHCDLQVDLVLGNHDRQANTAQVLAGLELAFHAHGLDLAPLRFAHEPDPVENRFTLAGHVHPSIHLQGPGRQRIKAPCFLFKPDLALLPAFGSFTGTHPIRPTSDDRIFALGPEEVSEVPLQNSSVRSKVPPRG